MINQILTSNPESFRVWYNHFLYLY